MNDLFKGKFNFKRKNILLSSSYFILEVTGWGEKCYIAYYFLKTHLVQKKCSLTGNFSSTHSTIPFLERHNIHSSLLQNPPIIYLLRKRDGAGEMV